MDQHIQQLDLPDDFLYKSLIPNLDKINETVYGIHGKVNLWFDVNEALLWIHMTENLTHLTTSDGSFLSQIPANFAEGESPFIALFNRTLCINFAGEKSLGILENILNSLWETWGSPFKAVCKPRLIVEQYDRKLELPYKYLISNSDICGTVSGMHGRVHLWPSAEQALLWINVAEN
jgi:hypothetical protein